MDLFKLIMYVGLDGKVLLYGLESEHLGNFTSCCTGNGNNSGWKTNERNERCQLL